MKNVIITILVILVLGLGGYLVYDKVIDKDNSNDVINDVTENNGQIDKETNQGNLSIVTDFINKKIIQTYTHTGLGNFELQENEIPYVQAAIPYINVDNGEAQKLNQQIQSDYNNVINIVKNDIKEQKSNKGPTFTIINYNYTIRNQILFIYIESMSAGYRTGGGSGSNAYYYDLENNKILNTVDVLRGLDKTVEQIKTIGGLDQNIINDLDNNISLLPVGNSVYVFPTKSFSFNSFKI